MGHAGAAAAAVRYLKALPGGGSPGTTPGPRPELRCVQDGERAPVDQAVFRRVLGNFASGVTVVTAPALTEGAPPAGFACQSFSSLSLDPPLVVFMVARTSTTWPRIARAGVFCVNVLAADQSALCRAFARPGPDKFTGVPHTPAPTTGSPRLAGTLAWIDCTIHAVHTGGDHLIVVGRVESLDTPDENRAPLLFHRGQFL
ncbi:flavin reductase family protein [Streptomyces roseirectus]|uniref:Flavin reductase family protein n=1 Tax=Streptomyces roseirectus TaxID=2768066 RepID=A0A7H0ISZ9_9ACTN|nr:flavin reductase family protein [Streptomyces roseirectus]QNP75915.1 flavin reductase family protein [Streptomyces roseirectus]